MITDQQKKAAHPLVIYIVSGRLKHQLDATSKLRIAYELGQQGWRVNMLSADEKGAQFSEGIEVICLPVPDIYMLRQVFFHLKMASFVLSKWATVEVVLFSQISAPFVFLLKLWRQLRGDSLPLFVMDTRTVPMEDKHTASLRDKIRGLFYNNMNTFANRWADGQTSITSRMAEVVKIPADCLWGVWPSGADVEKFIPAQKMRQWPQKGEPVQLAYIGVLHYERNLMSLCEAVEKANEEGMRFELSLTGMGTEKDNLEQFASQTESRIRVNSPVPHNQVPEVLSRAHVGVLPFPDEEKYRVCSPIKLFEYMAAGLPILATRIVCHTDVIQNRPMVFWAEDATYEGLLAALRLVWKARLSLKPMGDEAASSIALWTWKESGRKLSEALRYGLQLNAAKLQARQNTASRLDK